MEQDINSQVFEILYQGKMAWSVLKEPTYTEDGVLTGMHCTRRSDDKSILGNVGRSYKPFQNQQLVEEFIHATKEFGLTEIEGSSINGGKKVVLKARIGSIQIGSDTVHRYITSSNTHDGTEQISLGLYNRVKVCSNGLHRQVHNRELTKVRHTTNATEKMVWYIRNIPLILKAEEEMVKNYQHWSQIPLTDDHVKEVIRKVYEVDPEEKLEDISPKKRAQVQRFYDALKNNGTSVHGNTLWGLLNAQTYLSSRDIKGSMSEDRQFSGRSQEMSEMTYDTLLQYIGQELEIV